MNTNTQSITIDVPPHVVLDYMQQIEKLPTWAIHFVPQVRQDGERWLIVRGTRETELRLATSAEFGVVDFVSYPHLDKTSVGHSRTVPNGTGSEYMFTIFQPLTLSDEDFQQRIEGMAEELVLLKRLVEG